MALEFVHVDSAGSAFGHPWVAASGLDSVPSRVGDGQSISLVDSKGHHLGCGIFDRRDPCAAWRRYSHAEGIAFDETYIAAAMVEAIGRRGDESCQRLISSDADFLPGLIVELFGDVVWVSLETGAIRRHGDLVAEVIQEVVAPIEIVVNRGEGPQTFTGQGLKGRWIEVDELFYRIDLLNTQKPRFYLDHREQHSLVGSLCEGRAVLDLFSHSGAFALQAMRAGADRAVAVDSNEFYVKGVGANAQRNELQVETVAEDALSYMKEAEAGEFDAIILDPPATYFREKAMAEALHRMAFASLPPGGLLATYCRDAGLADFESLVVEAAAKAGREARIFARTSQPFDFPMLLNFPESQMLRGLILQVL